MAPFTAPKVKGTINAGRIKSCARPACADAANYRHRDSVAARAALIPLRG